jgi:hypothetical protein
VDICAAFSVTSEIITLSKTLTCMEKRKKLLRGLSVQNVQNFPNNEIKLTNTIKLLKLWNIKIHKKLEEQIENYSDRKIVKLPSCVFEILTLKLFQQKQNEGNINELTLFASVLRELELCNGIIAMQNCHEINIINRYNHWTYLCKEIKQTSNLLINANLSNIVNNLFLIDSQSISNKQILKMRNEIKTLKSEVFELKQMLKILLTYLKT